MLPPADHARHPGRIYAGFDDRRVQLAAGAIGIGAFLGGVTALYAVRYSWGHPVLLAAGATMVFAAITVISTVIGWRRHPNRARTKAEIDQWMLAGSLPDTVNLGTALPLIASRIDRKQRDLWRASVLGAIYVGEMLLQIADQPGRAPTIAYFSLTVAYGIGALGWATYYRIRWIPVLQTLLADEQQRFATPPDAQP